ncbi:hypothetical protein TNCV_4242181 [Trichonephila clavipes]|nr:hypothetical protein TNCV_4242181 [Trichonephila clavipes]
MSLDISRSTVAVKATLVRTNSYAVQLAIPNNPRYARFSTGDKSRDRAGQGRGECDRGKLVTSLLGVEGGVINSTRNGCLDTKYSLARHLVMVREDKGYRIEDATCVWIAANEAVLPLRVRVV